MGTQLWTSSIWLVLLVGSITQHSVAGSGACKQECPSTSTSVFHYQDGHKYTYDLEGTTVTSLPGTEGDVSTLQLKATVELSIQSACSHLVRLKGVQVIGPDAKKYGSLKELEAHSVLANFQSGTINSQICSEDGDSNAALNIKRAVLSLLQVASSAGSGSSSITEVDVFGSCPTQISSSKSGNIINVKKSRDLNKCAHREDLKQDVLSTPFVGHGDLQSTPLLDSSLEVEQQIKDGVIVSAVSHETYLFRPFSNQGSGAKTTVETKLTLSSDKAQATPAPASINVQRSIIFDTPHEAGSTANSNKQAILSALQTAGESMKVEVGSTSARKFSALVGVLRQSSKEDILSVYGQVKAGAGFSNKQSARKLLLDALFKTGTGESVQVAVELLKSNEISSNYKKLWYVNLAFARHATLPSLTSVSSLLDDSNLPREALLGIGSFAGRYCREHNCENVAEFNDLINKLAKQLTKPTSRAEETKVISVLKALHNIHHLNEAVADKLQQLATDKSLTARLRVATLETYHSDACRSQLKKSALEILKDQEEDSELRIQAYLVVVECPCGSVANSLKELLENEKINQVGSYIVSHLRNLRASANPANAEAKRQLGLVKSRKRFPEDFRKFSHNYALSYLIDAVNLGTAVESNVIFSQSSFVPRSVSLNSTVDIFGHSYNIFEISARAENVENILESYLGPNGYLKSHDLSELIKTARDSLQLYGNKIQEKLQSSLKRNKRSINKADLDRLKNEVIKSLPPGHNHDELLLDLSFKLYGSEVAWVSADNTQQQFSIEAIINKFFDSLDQGIEKAKQFSYDLKQHLIFLDSELTYPTGLGLPLKLVASGSSAAHLKLEGQVDIPALINHPGTSAVQLEVIPSATVEIIGQISIDAVAVESGLKVAYTLHTATGTTIAVKGINNVGVDINVGLPLKNQDIITIKTEVLSTVQERGHTEVDTPVQFNVNRKEYHGCFDQLSPLIGLTFCGDLNFPYDNPIRAGALFPLNGASTASLRIQSEDVSSFHFRAVVNKEDPKHRSVEILFDTPNTKIDRKLSLVIVANTEPNKEIKVSLNSPWKTVALQGILIDTDTEQSITAKFINDADEYSVRGGVKVSGDSNHQTYAPLLEYKSPSRSESYTKGGGRKGSQKLTEGFNIGGTVTVDKSGSSRKYTFNKVTLTTPKGRYEIDGTIQRGESSCASDLKISYGSQNVAVKTSLEKLDGIHYKISGYVIPSEYKDFALGLKWEYERTKDQIKNDLSVIHGSDQNSETSKIGVSQLIRYNYESSKNYDLSLKNSITYPLLDVNLKLEGSATPKNVDYDLEFHYDTYKIASQLNAKIGVKNPGDYDILFLIQILNNSLKLVSTRDIVSPDHSKFVNILELSPIVKYELTSDVTHTCQRNNINLQAVSVLKIDDQPKEYKLDIGLITNAQSLDTHAKLGVGSTVYVDTKVDISKDSAKPHGNIKIFILNYLDATSKFNFNKGGGHVDLSIDIPKADRKIRGSGDLTITGTVYAGKLDLHWNADKDPSQKLTIQTTTDIKSDAIDSKNVIIILEHKTTLNLKGALTGKTNDGGIIASGDIILPNGRHLTVKYDRTLHIRPTNSEGKVEIVLIDVAKQGSQPRQLTLEVGAKNVDQKQNSFNGIGKLEYKTTEGKDIKIAVNAKNVPHGEQNTLGGEIVVDGSLISQPLKLKLNAEVSKTVITYKANGGVGGDASVNVAGTIKTGLEGQSPKEIDNTIEIKLPTEQLKQVKLTTSGSLSSQPDSPCELKTNNVLTWNDDNTVKVDGQLTHDKVHGSGNIVITLPKLEPRTVAATWSNGDDANGIKKGGSVTLKWGGDKEAKVAGEIEIPNDKQSYKLKATINTPAEKLQSIDLSVSSKRVPTPAKHVETDIILIVNDQKTTVSSKLGLEPGVPVIDIIAVHPQGTSKLYINVEKLSPEQVKGEVKAQWVANGGGTFESDGEVKLSVDDFKLVLNVDSPKLKIDKWHVEAGQKAAKGSKKVVFSVKSAGKSLVSGSTTLRSKVDGNSVTYDGNGNVEIGDTKERFNFKVIRTQLVQDQNGETGIDYHANTEVGPRKYEAVVKVTNKEVRVYNKFCSKGSECSIIEATSRLKIADLNDVQHELVIIVDLKSLEIPHGISLKSNYERSGWNINQELDLQLQSKEHQTAYAYKLSISEKKSVLTFTLPRRVVSLEIITDIQVESSNGHQKLSFSLWWDKINKPSLVSSGSININHKSDKNGLQISGDAKFNNPNLERELSITGEGLIGSPDKLLVSSLDIDVFKNKNQKIVITVNIPKTNNDGNGYNVSYTIEAKSRGQSLDVSITEFAAASQNSLSYGYFVHYKIGKQPKKEVVLLLEAALDKFNALVKLPGITILSIDGTVKKQNDLPVVDGEIAICDLGTVVVHSALLKKGLISFSSYIHKKETPNKKIQISGGIDGGVSLSAVLKTGSGDKELAHVSISTKDKDFLKTDFGWSAENIKKVLQDIKNDISDIIKKVKDIVTDFINHLNDDGLAILETLRKSQPNFKRLLEVTQNQLKAIKTELSNDLVLKDISKNIHDTFGAVAENLEEVVKIVLSTLDAILTVVVEFENHVIEALHKISPKIKEAYTSIINAVVGILQNVLEELSEVVSKVADILKTHEEEIKNLVGVVRDLIQDVSQVFTKALQKILHEVNDFVKVFYDELKGLPIYSTIKEKYAQIIQELANIQIPGEVWGIIQDFLDPIKEALPTPELRELINAIETYVQKQLKKEDVDHKVELEAIYKKFVLAVKSLISVARIQVSEQEPGTGLLGYKIPISIKNLFQLPRVIAVHLSPLSYVTSDDLPTLSELWYAYRPTLNPLDWIPPFKAYGVLIGSQHIFTVDKRHYTFKGTCQYVLAQDFEEGKFGIIVNLEGGQLKSITVSDSKDTVELLADKSLKVNGEDREYPLRQGDIVAWKRYHSVNIKTKSGAHVHCHTDSDICVFHINGFYFDRTRGLLGTINNEPWDDFTLPNGHIASGVSEFGNAWRVNPQCSEVAATTVAAVAPNDPVCTDFFAGNSPISVGFLLVNPEPYREICNSLVATISDNEKKLEAACLVVTSYLDAVQHEIPVEIPDACVACTIEDSTVKAGSVVPVKTPQRSADVVIVVEQLLGNAEVFNELITPLVPTLINDFKAKGISDVKISLIGYGGPEQKWPSHYTSNGGKLGFGGSKNIRFREPEATIEKASIAEPIKALKWAAQKLTRFLQAADAFTEARDYPFRPDAVKTIIGVTSSSSKGNPLLDPLLIETISKIYRENGIVLNIVAPIEELHATGKEEKQLKQIVGLDSDHVFLQSDAKKKTDGDAGLRKSLEYEHNLLTETPQKTYGSVFNANNFISAKAAARKQFIQVVSHRIADSLTSHELIQDCSCSTSDEGSHAVPVCKVTSRREQTRKHVKG